jgi:chromodomain-helicase-DNA-binding protein 4
MLLKTPDASDDEEGSRPAANSAAAPKGKAKVKIGNRGKKKKSKKPEAIDHQDYCEVCQQGGEIILCDTCPKAYHLVCLDPELEEAPEGKWSCAKCEEEGRTADQGDDEDDEHQDFCRLCKDGGELLCCDSCPSAYHTYCLDPPLSELPTTSWTCPRCGCPPLPYKVAKILSWRWTDVPIDGPSTSSAQTCRRREYFVKWHNQSYWRCEWASEMQMDVYHNIMFRSYTRKHDMDEPPRFDDQLDEQDNRFKRIERMGKGSKNERGEMGINLEEKYYRYGVKPEWLIIHRVINHRTMRDGRTLYLVKWRELPYEYSTWEDEEEDLPGLKAAIEFYQDHRQYNLEGDRGKKKKKGRRRTKDDVDDGSVQGRFNPPPDRPQTDLKRKWDQQPEYFDELGLQLHPYQIEGINWLRYSWNNGTDTILADGEIKLQCNCFRIIKFN